MFLSDKEFDVFRGIEVRRRLRALNKDRFNIYPIGHVVCTVLDDLAVKIIKNKGGKYG